MKLKFFFISSVCLSLMLLTGCVSNDTLSQQANAGDQKNYIAGDGTIVEYAKNQRQPATSFEGKTFEGTFIPSTQLQGKPTVLNFWYASCAPCRKEASALEYVYQEHQNKVNFYGVNMRDTKDTVDAFKRNFHANYESFDDHEGKIILAFNSSVSPQAVPTTLVLDQKAQVAARVLGAVDKSTLNALIKKVLAEHE